MATSPLLESLRALVTPDLLSRASSLLGEPEAAISKALGAAFPLLAAGLARKADDPRAMESLYALVDDPANDRASIFQSLSSLLSDDAQSPLRGLVSRFLAALFGERAGSLAAALASYAGIRPGSASKLLSVAAPLLLSVVRDRVRSDATGAAGLGRWLASQRGALDEAVPPALTPLLGEPARRVASPPLPAGAASTGGMRWLWPLVALLLLGGLWAILRRPEEPRRAEQTNVPAATTPPVAAPPPVRTSERIRRALPGGVQLDIPATGLEQELIVFIEDPSRPLDEQTWFNFDRLLFETDSAVLKPESRAQLADVAAILKAYPTVRIKIGGYTDNQGDPAYNLGLSNERATNVMNELVALGVAADRIEAEGYGEQHPVASNDSEAGRVQNRRIALRVTQR
jgi:outer membrane protein OmpA-like peptidoglycan-associated protein